MSTELYAFGLAFGCGAAMLLLWDIFSGMRRAFARGVIVNIMLDTIWWLVSVCAFLRCMWKTVALELRFYEAFAVVLGAAVYKLTISGLMRRLFYGFFDIFAKIIKFICKYS